MSGSLVILGSLAFEPPCFPQRGHRTSGHRHRQAVAQLEPHGPGIRADRLLLAATLLLVGTITFAAGLAAPQGAGGRASNRPNATGVATEYEKPATLRSIVK